MFESNHNQSWYTDSGFTLNLMSLQNEADCLQSYDNFMRQRILSTCDNICAKLCHRLFNAIRIKQSAAHIHQLVLEARDYQWEILHSKSWDKINLYLRDTFGFISLVAAVTHIGEEELLCDSNALSLSEKKQIELADCGILLGSQMFRKNLQALISMIVEKRKKKSENSVKMLPSNASLQNDSVIPNYDQLILVQDKILQNSYTKADWFRKEEVTSPKSAALPSLPFFPSLPSLPEFLKPAANKVKRRTIIKHTKTPDLLQFYEKCLLSGTPTVLSGCMEEWPALSKWMDVEYYIKG